MRPGTLGESFQHTRLCLQIFPNKSIRFIDYLGAFYVKSRIKKIEKLPASFKDTVLEKVASQHKENVLVSFYPLVIVLHLVGYGNLFDSALLWLFALPQQSSEHLLPVWSLLVYVALSVWATWSQKAFYLLCVLASMYTFYLFLFV